MAKFMRWWVKTAQEINFDEMPDRDLFAERRRIYFDVKKLKITLQLKRYRWEFP
jgi:hypothetical protein